jgi:hypothetical protein
VAAVPIVSQIKKKKKKKTNKRMCPHTKPVSNGLRFCTQNDGYVHEKQLSEQRTVTGLPNYEKFVTTFGDMMVYT